MSNAKQFNLNLDRFAGQISADVTKVTKLAALKVLSGVIQKTPVDTGIARASWVIGVGASAGVYVDKKGSSHTTGDPADGSELSKLSKVNSLNRPETIIVSNYVPYIQRLEGGSSTQASKGMADITLMEVHNELEALTR